MKPIIALLLAILGTPFTPLSRLWAHAEKAYYLKGKLGEKEIAVKMLCYDETPAIRYVQYFFANDKKDRYMVGKLIDGFWQFAPSIQPAGNFPRPEGTLRITPYNTNWQGSWTNNKGRKWPLLLIPIDSSFIPVQFSYLPLLKQMDPYERYRLAMLHFTKTTIQKIKNAPDCSWYIEKESGISFFRLGTRKNGINTTSINAALEATHLYFVQQYFAYSPQKTDARPETKLLYLTNELVSFRTVSIRKFLSLSTSQTLVSATLDITTGTTLKLEDIIWLDKATARPATGDFFTLYQYRKKVLAPQLFQWLQELYPQQMKATRCGINKAENWNLPAWNLTDKGLALGLNASDECQTAQWAIIPYARLQPFKEGKYHLQTSG